MIAMNRIWAKRIISTISLVLGLLAGIIVFPGLVYAHRSAINSVHVFYQTTLSPGFEQTLQTALADIRNSPLSTGTEAYDLCLDDGSIYPGIIRRSTGAAFARGFGNKVVLMAPTDAAAKRAILNGHAWDLEQLIAHEMTHCLQFKHYGLWHSNPLAGHADWKWEGYPEWVARRKPDQLGLIRNIARKVEQDKTDPNGWSYTFSDGTESPRNYYDAWLLMQYCLDVKKMSYDEVLNDKTTEAVLQNEMMRWYSSQLR